MRRPPLSLGMPRTRFPVADVLSQAEMHAGRYEAACALMQEACMASMGVSREIEAVDRVFDALAGTTDRAAAVAALDGLRDGPGCAGLHHFMRRRLLLWYSMLGAYDQAYEVMNRSLDEYAATGTIGVAWGLSGRRSSLGFGEDARFTRARRADAPAGVLAAVRAAGRLRLARRAPRSCVRYV